MVGGPAPGDRLLVQRNWLSLDPRRHDLRRVRSLEDVLDGGRYELAANDWIVVHEALLEHRALQGLRLAASIEVNASFRGNQGPDFAIYEAPSVEPLAGTLDVRLDDPGADDYLGHEWPARDAATAGTMLPVEGARIFLPPLGGGPRRLYLDVAGVPNAPAEIEIFSAGRRLAARPVPAAPVPDITARADGIRRFSLDLSTANVGPFVVELFVRPVGGNPVRVLGFRLE